MRIFRFASLILFLSGITFLMLALMKGEIKGGIFFIFPFLYGSGIYASLGIFLIFFSILAFFLSLFHGLDEKYDFYEKPEIEKKEGGAVVMIGPIPVIISTSLRIAVFLFIVSILIFGIMLIFILSQLLL